VTGAGGKASPQEERAGFSNGLARIKSNVEKLLPEIGRRAMPNENAEPGETPACVNATEATRQKRSHHYSSSRETRENSTSAFRRNPMKKKNPFPIANRRTDPSIEHLQMSVFGQHRMRVSSKFSPTEIQGNGLMNLAFGIRSRD